MGRHTQNRPWHSFVQVSPHVLLVFFLFLWGLFLGGRSSGFIVQFIVSTFVFETKESFSSIIVLIVM